MAQSIDVVTGSFSFTGQYITRRLLAAGRKVITLTGHPRTRHPLAAQVPAFPYEFEHPERLVDCLRGADTLFNTYWVRFPHGRLDYEVAVGNLRTLIQASSRAGIRKIVDISIVNASETSQYAYFRAKARVEKAIQESGLAFAILRPTVVFGPEDVLVNNIAWMVRRFPIFMMPGRGDYLIQPIYVEDLADLAVAAGDSPNSEVIDAAGPETFTYRELVRQIAIAVGRNIRLAGAPAPLVYMAGTILGRFLHDVVLTYEEVVALKSGVLYSAQTPRGKVGLRQWLAANRDTLGRQYRSEIRRHFLT